MKGWGTDENTLIRILTERTNAQRQEIEKYFRIKLGRNLVEDLRSELSGNFEKVMIALMRKPNEFACMELHKALTSHMDALAEILCSKTAEEIEEIVRTYKQREWTAVTTREHKTEWVSHLFYFKCTIVRWLMI